MINKKENQQDNPFEAYNQQNGELRKFSDELLEKYKGKVLEIYIGDQNSTLNFEEFSIPQNCSIFGRLVEVLDRFIIVNCFYIDQKTKKLKDGNLAYINSFQIRAMTPLDGNGSLQDIFLAASDAKKIKNLILDDMKK